MTEHSLTDQTGTETKDNTKKQISIICPVFNEERSIPLFYDRLVKSLAPVQEKYSFEIIFTNNRSEDNSLRTILDIRKNDLSVQVLTLSRNFGYQCSVQAGMFHASGDGIIVIDVDCEDPPEMIPQFLSKWEEGFDVVYGIRGDRPGNWITKKARNFFYHFLEKTADMDIILYMAEFALISSHVRDAIINNRNTFPFLRAEIGYAGFSKHGIRYDRQVRNAGKSSYNSTSDLVTFAIAGILTSSTFLFRFAGYSFFPVALLNLLCTMVSEPGNSIFQTLVIFDLVYLIFLLTFNGIYLARTYKNIIGRPIYIVDQRLSKLNKPFRSPDTN